MSQQHTHTRTLRTDAWRFEVLAVWLGLAVFIVYATWAAFQANHYFWNGSTSGFGGYHSPFYSPMLFWAPAAGAAPFEHAWFGAWPEVLKVSWLSWLPLSPSFFIILIPLSFRITCYYFRRIYYRGITGNPSACAVSPAVQKEYFGETRYLIFQNLHRYALYAALLLVVFHLHDVYMSFFNNGKFGVGIGSLFILGDVTLLSCYVFGCHSLRHLVGGKQDCFSCADDETASYKRWKIVSFLNERHGFFGWASLYMICLADLYIRLVSMGIIRDLNTWGI